MKFVDLTGRRFGKWYVKERYFHPTIKKSFFVCVCDCGTEKVVKGCSLNGGKSTNCGCHQYRKNSVIHSTHGHTKNNSTTSEYGTWSSMMTRCNNSKANNYHNYGGRGISVCERWTDFSNFIEDMGFKPDNSYTIDRIDVNGDYTPDNCKWASRKEQSINRRLREGNSSGVSGVAQIPSKRWKVSIGRKHIGVFDTFDQAVRARGKAVDEYLDTSE